MSAYSDLLLSTSPVAYWRFGEPSGTAAVDATGNGHDGTYVNGPVLGQPGLIADTDTAVFFDGSNDRVDVPQDPALQIAGAVTVQAWIRPTVLAADMRIIFQGDIAGTSVRLFDLGVRAATQDLVFAWRDGAGAKALFSDPGVLSAGGIFHVVATRDASLFVRFYVDGVEVGSGQGTAPTGVPSAFRIGRLGDNQQSFHGTIDEPAVHNVALTPAQVADLYELGKPPPPPPSAYRDAILSTSPVAYWRFGEPSGTAAVDATGNGHDGTYVNGPVLGQPGLIADTDTAVFFDGVNDHVAVTQDPALRIAGALTAQAWIRPTAITGGIGGNIIFQGIGNDTQYALQVLPSGALRFNWYDGAFKDLESPAGVVTVGSTHHVVATRDASLFVRFYVDGVEVGSGQGTAPIGNPASMFICFVNANFRYAGVIDEVAVHNVALTPEQIGALYDLGVNGPPPPPPPPPPPSGGGVTRPARRYHRMGRGISR